MWFQDGSDPVKLSAPVAWWTWPGPYFEYGCESGQAWDHYYVTFTGSRTERMLSEGLLPIHSDTFAFVPIASSDRFRQDWDRLFALLREKGGLENSSAVHFLEGMLLQLGEQSVMTQKQTPLSNDVAELARAIRASSAKHWDWQEEAERIGVSVVHLRRVFREYQGVPPQQFLLRTRMEVAAHTLRTTQDPIKSIAFQIGVPDMYYFSKLFKL